MHGELIEMNKIRTQRKKERVDKAKFFQPALYTHGLRGHSQKLFVTRCRTTVQKTFFSNKIIDDYNRLPQYVIDSSSVNVFKMKRGKIWTSFNKFLIFISLSCLLKQPKVITFTFYVTAYVICVCIRF